MLEYLGIPKRHLGKTESPIAVYGGLLDEKLHQSGRSAGHWQLSACAVVPLPAGNPKRCQRPEPD